MLFDWVKIRYKAAMKIIPTKKFVNVYQKASLIFEVIIQARKYEKHDFEITVYPKGPASEPTFRFFVWIWRSQAF